MAAAHPDGADPRGREHRHRRHRHGHRRRRIRRLRRLGLLALLLLVVVGIGAGGVLLARERYLPLVDEAKALKTDVQAILGRAMAAGLEMDAGTVASIRTDTARAATRLERLQGVLNTDPLVALARRLPPTAHAVRGADAVSAAASDLLRAAGTGLSLADRYVAIRQEAPNAATGGVLAGLVELMASTTSDVASFRDDLHRAMARLDEVPGDSPSIILGAKTEIAAKLSPYLPALDAFAAAGAVVPDMLGWSAPKRYLVLTQDPAELRPTGGYIGSFGVLAFDRGRLTERTFRDVFAVDLPADYPYVAPPAELADALLGPTQSWALADANWSPDFPTSAQDALRLYANETGDTKFDGVLAIDTYTIDELLRVTGPVAVPDFAVTVAPGETTLTALRLTRAPAPGDSATERKRFLSSFAAVLFPTLLTLPPRRWLDLAGRAETFRAQRLLQVWSADPKAEAALVAAGWDGGVADPTPDPAPDASATSEPQLRTDFVYPVDANVAPTSKLNLVTSRSLNLAVQIDATGTAASTLDVAWDNQIATAAGAGLRGIEQLADERILGLVHRLVLPGDARLDAITMADGTQVAPTVLDQVAGRQMVGVYLRVPPGGASLAIGWTVPYVAQMELGPDGRPIRGEYRLLVRHQPGTRAGPLTIRIAVPQGMRITDASSGMVVEGGLASVTLSAIDRDVLLGVRFAATGVSLTTGSPVP